MSNNIKAIKLSNRPVFVTSNNIKAVRQAAKLTVEQVADKCGVGIVTALSWETGEHHPQRLNAIKVSALLNSFIHRSSIQFSYSTERADQLLTGPTQ